MKIVFSQPSTKNKIIELYRKEQFLNFLVTKKKPETEADIHENS